MIFIAPVLTVFVLLAAVALDAFYGEPKRWHPLVGFGRWVSWIEQRLWQDKTGNRRCGIVAVAVVLGSALLAAVVITSLFCDSTLLSSVMATFVLYVCIAPRSLREHAEAVAAPLAVGDLQTAREKLAFIVSRDTTELSETEISSAVCESVLENGSDGIFAAIFWFVLAGVPGVVLYRAANTLDAMWGYKNQRYQDFGWAAAKFDDVMNWLPARLVAFSYALMGNFQKSIRCWSAQASQWKSPNAGPVMAAGAGSLNISLGGAASYHGEQQQRPSLGCGAAPRVRDINRALDLVERVLYFWLLVLVGVALFS